MSPDQTVCWHCGGPVGAVLVCPTCGAIHPHPESLDYFAVLELPRRLQLNESELPDRFHRLSRRVHPDFYQTKSSREQALSLAASARLNQAYRTLRDPIERLAYLIRLETGQKEIAAKAPNELLEEIFDLQELLEEYRGRKESGAAERLRDAQAKLRTRLARLDAELAQLAAEWDRTTQPSVIAALQDRLAGRQYLMNTIEDITLTLEGREHAKDRRH